MAVKTVCFFEMSGFLLLGIVYRLQMRMETFINHPLNSTSPAFSTLHSRLCTCWRIVLNKAAVIAYI